MIDVTAQVRKHATDMRVFRRKLFSEEADSTAFVRSGDVSEMPLLRRLGPIRSVIDRHAELTIVGDVMDQQALLEDPERRGVILTLSVAAHHRMLGSRLLVDPDEATAWVVALPGDEWAEHAYAAGALSSAGTGSAARLTTQYFYVFISSDGKPHEAPTSFSVPLRRLGA